MSAQTAWTELVGDLSRFGEFTERVEEVVERQIDAFEDRPGDWLVLPWTDGFYLFSKQSEGQRRGREVIDAFLGPGMVAMEPQQDVRSATALPRAWARSHLTLASRLRRVESGPQAQRGMLARLEELVAATVGRPRDVLETKPAHPDLLRDLRLALNQRDYDAARARLEQLRLDGHMSAENLRYLEIEYLAAFGRWVEMASLPYIAPLVMARRPRAISETLLQMVWWTRLVDTGRQRAQTFQQEGLLDEYGPLLRSIRVPATRGGRILALLTAWADGDTDRQQAVLDAAQTPDELQDLVGLVSAPDVPEVIEPSAETSAASASMDTTGAAYAAGQFADVIDAFIAEPRSDCAEWAVASVLDTNAADQAHVVLALVMDIESHGTLTLSRRGRDDLEQLKRVVSDACEGWVEWTSRLADQTRWPDASSVARDQEGAWKPIAQLESQEVDQIADALLEAAVSENADQVRFSLDLLCKQATETLKEGVANNFCHSVLILLSEQENLSEPVRNAYLDLFEAWLLAGPTVSEYRDVLNEATGIWNRINAPRASPWAISILTSVSDFSCPDEASRTAFVAHLVAGMRHHHARLGLRERVEVECLADNLGIGAVEVEAPQDELDVWAKLDGRMIGIYSLLPRVGLSLRKRLDRLCSVGEVRENQDKVATPSLRNLAKRAEYLIVDTWHAAHQATEAIDAVRPRDRQILPRQRGLSGFLLALEEALYAEAGSQPDDPPR